MNSVFSNNGLFDEVDRLNRRMWAMFSGVPASIRAGHSGVFPK